MSIAQEEAFNANKIDTEAQNTSAYNNWQYRMRNYKNEPRIDCVDSLPGGDADSGSGESE